MVRLVAQSMLEDSGYMARAAFVMDRLMHLLGLHGKSFIPLIVGFGCNVPAIMATRTLESAQERKLTILMNPFMSCGARLPVYALFAAAFFENGRFLAAMFARKSAHVFDYAYNWHIYLLEHFKSFSGHPQRYLLRRGNDNRASE